MHVDYGPQHVLRGGKYTINRQSFEEVASFCREGHFYKKSQEEKILLYKQYIFGVSSLFILLHLHEVLNINATKRWMASDEGKGFSRISCPLYFPMCHSILDSIRKILPLQKNGQTIVSSICQLPDILSEAAFFQILLLMKDDDALSSSSLSSYQALGEFMDHIYLAVNGTLTGSYIGRDPGPGQSQIPDIPLDHAWIQSQYSSLPHHLKQDFHHKIRRNIYFLEERLMTDKKNDFQKLDRSLR